MDGVNNNKGFTLIELLTVIVILTGISWIVVAGITASLDKRDERECEEQIELAKNAAKIYFALHSNFDTSTGVSISILKNEGYFNETSKINRLNDSDSVKISSNIYVYTGTGECKES